MSVSSEPIRNHLEMNFDGNKVKRGEELKKRREEKPGMWVKWMPVWESACWLGFESCRTSPKALIRRGPLIPLALTAFVIAGATSRASTPAGTWQFSKSHHTETLTSREWCHNWCLWTLTANNCFVWRRDLITIGRIKSNASSSVAVSWLVATEGFRISAI